MLRKSALIILAVLLTAGSPILNAPSQPPTTQASKQNPTQDQRGTESVPFVIKILEPPKTEEELAKQKALDDAKILSDEALVRFTGDLAQYTFGLFIATLVLALITGGLVIAAFLQVRDTKKIIANSNRQHALSQRAFAYVLRLLVSPVRNEETGAVQTWVVVPSWANSGETPTKNATIRVNWLPNQDDLPDDFDYTYNAPESQIFLGPKAEVGSGRVDIPGTTIENIKNANARAYVWGRIDYYDVFSDARHYTKFCFRIDAMPSGGDPDTLLGFVLYGPHNGSDESEPSQVKRKRWWQLGTQH